MIFSNGDWKIFIASFIAFILLNTIENILHYNIGRTTDKDTVFVFQNPTRKDWMRIVVVMIIFAILQALLTIAIERYE